MFGKDKNTKDTRFEKQYCRGFNVGVSLVKQFSPDQQELTKEILHAMILEQPKDVSYHATLAGFSYDIVNQRNKERQAQRLEEIEKINEKTKNREIERGR